MIDNQNTPLNFYNDTLEMRTFLDSTENLTALSKQLQPMYLRHCKQLNLYGNEVSYVEKITPLEIVARENKPEHLKAILFSESSHLIPWHTSLVQHLTSFLRNSVKIHPTESHTTKQPVEAFFRALSKGHSDIAQILLTLPEVREQVSTVHITSMASKDPLSVYKSYIERIQRPSRYRRLNLAQPNHGNIALILAAQLGDTVLFFDLLEHEAFNKQLPQSGIQAFLCATTKPDGSIIQDISFKMDIIERLLDCPNVFDFVYSRIFDFECILEAYIQKRLKQLHDAPNDAIDNMSNDKITLCVYFILYMIEYKPEFAANELDFLLNIESVKQMSNSLSFQNQYPALRNLTPTKMTKNNDHFSSLSFFKLISPSPPSETDLSTLAASPWHHEIEGASRGASALTVNMDMPVTPPPHDGLTP